MKPYAIQPFRLNFKGQNIGLVGRLPGGPLSGPLSGPVPAQTPAAG